MITFAAPQCAWFLLLPAGIVALYLLRRKYLPKQVPSTFLWKAAIRDHTANKPLQRLRKNLLLPVQFLAGLVLALSLMQPNLTGGAASRTVMIFDLSGSMQTVSEGKSRLEEAKDRAEEILDGLPPGEEVTVLAAGTEVRQVLNGSTDREDIRRAVRSLVCGRDGADLAKAVSLAEANIRRLISQWHCPVMIAEIGMFANNPESEVVMSDFIQRAQAIDSCAGVFYWEPEVYGGWRPQEYIPLGWGSYDMGAFTPDGQPSEVLKILLHSNK